MKSTELQTKVNEIRTAAVAIINNVLDNAGITELNLQDVGTGDYPLTHEGEECAALQYIEKDENGNLEFESDTETMMDTIYDGEDNLSTDTLVKIAEWMEKHEDTIKELVEEEESSTNYNVINVTDGQGGWTEKEIQW